MRKNLPEDLIYPLSLRERAGVREWTLQCKDSFLTLALSRRERGVAGVARTCSIPALRLPPSCVFSFTVTGTSRIRLFLFACLLAAATGVTDLAHAVPVAAPPIAAATAVAKPAATADKPAVAAPAVAAPAVAPPAAATSAATPAPADDAKPAPAPAIAAPADDKPAGIVLDKPGAEAGEPPDAQDEAPKPKPVPKIEASGKAGPFSFRRDGDELTVELSTSTALSAAIFMHHGDLWFVAAQPGLVKDAQIEALPPGLQKVTLLPSDTLTILRIEVGRDATPFVSTNDTNWKVESTPIPVTPRDRLAFSFPVTNAGNAIEVGPHDGIVKPLPLKDPVTGATLYVIPLPAPVMALGPGREFVDLHFLPAGHGIAYVPHNTEITVTTADHKLRFTGPRSLHLSPSQPQIAYDEITTLPPPVSNSFLAWQQWRLPPPEKMQHAEQQMTEQLLDEHFDNASYARLRLVQFLMSDGLYYEALGLLGEMKKSDPDFYVAHKAAALHGVANFMVLRIGDAVEDFNSKELAGLPETDLWLNICGELLGDPTKHFDYMAYNDRLIRNYPVHIRQNLALVGADLYITRKDYASARKIFDSLTKDNVIADVQKSVDYLLGKIAAETGQIDVAIDTWEKLTQEYDDRFIRARSEFSLVNLLLQQNRISRKEAIKRLDALRIVWRGDSLEMNLLSLLGNLYLEEKDYIMALRTLYDLIAYYPNSPEAVASARKMSDAFIYLFNQGGADGLAPLEALALYREFVALTPIGEIGDRIIQKMAERLVKADLLDQAAQLLQDQINSRLQKQDRSRVGTRLALIHLMNRNPREALNALELTGYGQNPLDLEQQRAHIAARAFAALKEYDKALTVLEGDTSDEAQAIKLDIFWSEKNWKEVINMCENKLGNRADPTRPLTVDESHVLIRLAVAYTFGNDTAQLQYLKDYFSPLMKASPDRQTFEFITQQTDRITPANFDQLTKDIESIQSYLKTYRDRVREEGLAKAAEH